jgi:hypothetical protein
VDQIFCLVVILVFQQILLVLQEVEVRKDSLRLMDRQDLVLDQKPFLEVVGVLQNQEYHLLV